MASLAPAEKAPSGKPLKVGSPHDPAEREADRIADLLTTPEEPAMPVCAACAAGGAPCAACGGGLLRSSQELGVWQKAVSLNDQRVRPTRQPAEEGEWIQRKAAREEVLPKGPSVQSRLDATSGTGDPLPSTVRSRLQRQLGADLGGVRLHTDAHAHALSRELRAHAFTHQENIYFGPDRYQPETQEGKWLLAHEATHVVQQNHQIRRHYPDVDCQDSQGNQVDSRSDVHETQKSNGAKDRVATNRVQEHIAPCIQGSWISDGWDSFTGDRGRQFAIDIVDSVLEAPRHFRTVLGDVGESILENWAAFSAALLGILSIELAIAVFAGLPEPSTISKWVAAALQILMILLLGYIAGVELGQVIDWGALWIRSAWNAEGDRARITSASIAFCHLLLHIALLILALIGAGMRFRGLGMASEGGAGRSIGSTPRLRASAGGGSGAAEGGDAVSRTLFVEEGMQPMADGTLLRAAQDIVQPPAPPLVTPSSTGSVLLGSTAPSVSVAAPELPTEMAMAINSGAAAGNLRQVAKHLARLLRLPEVGGQPPEEDPDPNRQTDNHWWREIKRFLNNIRAALRGAVSRRQALSALRREGFTDEQIADIEARLAEAAEYMNDTTSPGFLPPP